jgi:hypothetical protein
MARIFRGDFVKTSRIAIAAALAMLAGCAGQHTKMSEDDRKMLTEQPVHAVHFKAKGGFLVESTGYTVAGVLFTPLVAIGQAAEGMSIMGELGLEDPVIRVKERVLGALEQQYRMPNLIRVAQPLDQLTYNYNALSGVVFEVRTTAWGIDNNRAKYAAGIRVIRVVDRVTLWDAVCDSVIADKSKPSPTGEMLRADKGALLKSKLNQAAEACADQLAGWAVERAERR